MEFTDYYLRATGKNDLLASLVDAGLAHISPRPEPTEDGDAQYVTPLAPAVALDLIGPMREGNQPNRAPIPGFHANLRCSEPLSTGQLAQLGAVVIPAPQTPVRVWF